MVSYDAIMLFGDSLTQGGWVAGGFAQQLAYVYARKLDIINRGLSGYNTEWSLAAFEHIFPKRTDNVPKIRLLTLWFGANDACLEPSPQYVTRDKFIQNLRQMISMVQSSDSEHYSPDTRIILITPPPISETARAADLSSRNPPIALDRSASNTKSFADAVIELGKELSLPVVDIYGPISEASGGTDDGLVPYLYDGLHLSAAGYKILYDALIKTIASEYPDLHYENLPMVYRPWAQLDWKDPRSSILSQWESTSK
ncbi:hypothetical protein FRC03_010798 [Tulasnella sp. 419]|nr:hypothetical protein FRC03_010798 [Tulasnella sp. 419]